MIIVTVDSVDHLSMQGFAKRKYSLKKNWTFSHLMRQIKREIKKETCIFLFIVPINYTTELVTTYK